MTNKGKNKKSIALIIISILIILCSAFISYADNNETERLPINPTTTKKVTTTSSTTESNPVRTECAHQWELSDFDVDTNEIVFICSKCGEADFRTFEDCYNSDAYSDEEVSIVDFNGDGIVNAKDYALYMKNQN